MVSIRRSPLVFVLWLTAALVLSGARGLAQGRPPRPVKKKEAVKAEPDETKKDAVGGATAEPTVNDGASDKRSSAARERRGGKYRARDPFWPVGWQPDIKDVSGSGVNWTEAEEKLTITGSARMPPDKLIVFVNGDPVKEGDIVPMRLKNYIYTWTVRSIRLEKGHPKVEYDRQTVRRVGG